MKSGGPERFPQNSAKSEGNEGFVDLEKAAKVLAERTAKLPPIPEAANDNEKEEFGSDDLGPTIRKMIGRG